MKKNLYKITFTVNGEKSSDIVAALSADNAMTMLRNKAQHELKRFNTGLLDMFIFRVIDCVDYSTTGAKEVMSLWTYSKPTVEGWYEVNLGDVVTADNYSCERFTFNVNTSELLDSELGSVQDYNDSYKFRAVDFEALNKIGNAE